MPTDEFTEAELGMMASVRDASSLVEEDYYHGTVSSTGPRPRSEEEWVEEGTVAVFDFAPDDSTPYPWTIFYKFVTKDALTPEDLPHTEDFCFSAEDEPFTGYSVPATERLLLAASVTGDVAGI